jgi:biopolymer transport protein ExbB
MSRLALLLALCLAWPLTVWAAAEDGGATAQIEDLDELLRAVREERQRQRARNAEREAQFLSDRRQQQARLAEARREFERRQRENQPLAAITEANAVALEELRGQLDEVVQDMGDLASTFGEFAGDFAAVLQESMISAQFPERGERLRALAAGEGQPSIVDIESLWLLLQEEMTEARRVARFDAPVVAADGTATTREVLRVGPFTAFSDADFLRYVPETGELLVLSRQPAARYRGEARVFVASPGELLSISVDPTRGSLLGMLGYTPDLRERIEQGGSIALIILGLGALGLLIALWRVFHLLRVQAGVRAQLAQLDSPRASNPLGRVLLAVHDVDMRDEEQLHLKLDEAVLAEIPALERGTSVIKLLAATSPLLGLLGTVTGMILTFQAISLFGTGDPKLMAGGISQALVTTVLGLVVAIPLLFSHSLVAYLSRSLVQRLDEQCAGVLARNAEREAGSS